MLSFSLALFVSVAVASWTPHNNLQHRQAPSYPNGSQIILVAGELYVKSLAYDGKSFEQRDVLLVPQSSRISSLTPNYEQNVFYIADWMSPITMAYGFDGTIGSINKSKNFTLAKGNLFHLTQGLKKEGRSTELLGASFNPPALVIYDATSSTHTISLSHVNNSRFWDPVRPDKEKNEFHQEPRQIILDPSGDFYVVLLAASDVIVVFNTKNNIVTRFSTPPRCDPRRGSFWTPPGNPAAPHLRILCNLSNSILLYEVSSRPGSPRFSLVQTVNTIDYAKTHFSSSLEMLVTGRNPESSTTADVYVTTNGTDGDVSDAVMHFEVVYDNDANSVNLQHRNARSSEGLAPNGMALDETGRRLFVTNQYKSTTGNSTAALVAFSRDPTTGELTGIEASMAFDNEYKRENYTSNGPMVVLPWTPGTSRT